MHRPLGTLQNVSGADVVLIDLIHVGTRW